MQKNRQTTRTISSFVFYILYLDLNKSITFGTNLITYHLHNSRK